MPALAYGLARTPA